MHRWRPAQKRVMLLAMLVPAVLVPFGIASAGTVFVERELVDEVLVLGTYGFFGALVIGFVCGATCIADAFADRRVETEQARNGWLLALLVVPAAAAPAYWWLHVRQEEGGPHGVETLRPASQWSPRAKALTGAAVLLSLALLIAWTAWVVSFFVSGVQDHWAPAAFAALAVLSVTGTALITLFLLDALRRGATVWAFLVVLAAPVAVPLYWLLRVRPTAPPGGGP